MHATVQPGGHSPKPNNGPNSSSQLKSSSENVQSSVASYPSQQLKGKKRERVEQDSELIKRERSYKADGGGYDVIYKSEIAKITEKGALVDYEGVEKLVQLMQPGVMKMDLISRTLFASVIADTDKFEYLTRFVQLRGLPVLDEWLQDINKGKLGGSSQKDDKCVDEFLWILLRALDKLPVNLDALQKCNIGKSVNQLRSHKNSEIQKKARSLVDTWKKRVEAEMNMIDAKSGSGQAISWTSKSRLPEASHGGTGNRHVDFAMRGSISAVKASSTKPLHGETPLKSASSSPRTVKSSVSPLSGKGSAADVPLTTMEEKSSGSSQSHNCSQSFSGKDDARSSTAGSMSVNKISSGASRHRKSSNSFHHGLATSGKSSRHSSSLHRNSGPESISKSELTCEKALDSLIVEGNNQNHNHKLIVKIPNHIRSPAQSASGGSLDDSSIMNSRASSPMISERHDQFDSNLKGKSDAYQANMTSDANNESYQSNDFKDVLTGSEEGDGSPGANPEEERSRKLSEVSIAASSSSGNEHKSGEVHYSSFINALVESCAKYSEPNVSISLGDNIGMNLLASVAAGEISKSTPMAEETCMGDDAKSKLLPGREIIEDESRVENNAGGDNEKEKVVAGVSSSKELHSSKHASVDFSGDRKTVSSSEETPSGKDDVKFNYSSMDLLPNEEPCSGSNANSDKMKAAAGCESVSPACTGQETSELSKEPNGEKKVAEDKVRDVASTKETDGQAVKASSLRLSINGEKKNLMGAVSGDMKPATTMNLQGVERTNEDRMHLSGSCEESIPGNGDDLTVEKADENFQQAETRDINKNSNHVANECRDLDSLQIATSEEVQESLPGAVAPHAELPALSVNVSKLNCIEAGKTEEHVSTSGAASISAVGATGSSSRLKFDLNEGFIGDDGKYGEQTKSEAPGRFFARRLIRSLPYAISPVPAILPASITVAAAAKGPFVPPEVLLKSKGEFGWKGSAATSAFRPAEPRKAPDTRKSGRFVLDIDLNVPGEGVFEDMDSHGSAAETASTSEFLSSRTKTRNEPVTSAPLHGGLDLDLNQVDEVNDMGLRLTSNIGQEAAPLLPLDFPSSSGLRNVEVKGGFDLNNGPGLDETSAEPLLFNQHGSRGTGMQFQPPVTGFRINNPELGNISPRFPRGNTPFSPVTVPSTGGPPRIIGGTSVGTNTPFTTDIYRGTVVSSSPAVPFLSNALQYSPVFPFGTSFPLPSATTYMDSFSGGRPYFPGFSSQFVGGGGGGTVSSSHPRPPAYMVSLPDGESNRKWNGHGLDLNTGPGGGMEIEGRGEALLHLGSRQVAAEGQARVYQVPGGVMKRKEPEGSWDGESFRYKQSSWH